MEKRLGLDCVTAFREVDGLVGGTSGGGGALVLGQSSPDGAGLLRTEVEGEVLLLLEEFPEVLAGLLVHDGEDASNRLADSGDPGELRSVATRDLLDTELGKLGLELLKLLEKLVPFLGDEL